MRSIFTFLITSLVLASCAEDQNESIIITEPTIEPWSSVLDEQIKLLGHRNWIVVVDEAYPLQSSPGIITILSDKDHLETITHVLNIIQKQHHIAPTVYLDKEIDFVEESSAAGITAFRNELHNLTGVLTSYKMLHEDIIATLDKASQQFSVLIIKTDFTIPYTSVFFELGCKYWNAELEEELRNRMPDS
ncbi:MAG: hypothetical protein HKN87_20045 [Saprospiraceae bacterium]|nr:hypothetical protein [Saprospiraceae bacterium]